MDKNQLLWVILLFIGHFSAFAQMEEGDKVGDVQEFASLRFSDNNDDIQSSSFEGNRFYASINNLSSVEKKVHIQLTSSQPYDWDVFFVVKGVQFYSNTTISVKPGENDIFLQVIPGSKVGIGRYKLKTTEVGSSFSQVKNFILIHKVSDLIITSKLSLETGTILRNGLSNAANDVFGEMTIFEMFYAFELGILSDLNNIYFCIEDKQPILFDELFHYFTDFLDEGGNLFISGQDIGNDIHEKQEIFYKDYLGIDYLGKKNVRLVEVNEHNIFKEMESSFLLKDSAQPDFFNSNQENTIPIFRFENGDVVGTRTMINEFKVVYLGFDLLDIEDESVASKIVELVDNWFNRDITLSAFDANISLLSGFNFPNPANHFTNIKIDKKFEDNLNLRIINIQGQEVFSKAIHAKNEMYHLNTVDFQNGTYFYQLLDSKGYHFSNQFIKN